MYLSYFLYANGDGFPCFGSRHCFCSVLRDLCWRDDYLVANRKYRHHPMAAIGRWVYGLGKCIGRYRSDHGKLHDSYSLEHDVLPGCSY